MPEGQNHCTFLKHTRAWMALSPRERAQITPEQFWLL